MQIKESRGGVDTERLEAFETRLGARLPGDYRQFLLEHNGGYPEPGAFAIPGTRDVTQVSRFLALDGESWDDLEIHRERYDGRVPFGWLPIAYDDFGNLLVLAIAGEPSEAVGFWDHEAEAGEPRHAARALTVISADFSSFLSLLRA